VFLGKTLDSLHPGILMGTGNFNAGGNPAMHYHPLHYGEKIFLVTSCYRNRDKPQFDGPLGLYIDFTFTYLYQASI